MTAIDSPLADALRDRYTLEKELGRGGMATVYLARDLRHKRRVALKMLHPDLSYSLGADRFLREIETVANLTHPHVLPLHDSGEAAGLLYYVMPFVEGESLRDRLKRETQLPVEDALRIAREVADALSYAHGQGVVHRDIKPENLLLTSDGSTLVADFGIARALGQAGAERLTETGLAVGTAAYMSPEQASGGQVDGRSDVYALGCVLYEMLAGEPPFTGPTAQAITLKRLTDPVPGVRRLRPAVPAGVERAAIKALAPVPADRWSGAREFAQALGERAAHEPARGGRFSRRTLTVGFAALMVLAVAGALVLLDRRAPAPEDRPGVEASTSTRTQLTDPTRFAKSVAVLPLVNVGGDPGQEYFADGMTDELTSALGKVPGLRIAARSSAFTFKGKEVDVREVGTKLHVGAVLEGSVRRAGPRLRVATQLVSTRDGLTLWSDRYDRELTDVFQVQDEIATAIVGALRLTLGNETQPRVEPSAPTSLEAHDLYLRARFHALRSTESDLRQSLKLYDRALALDSLYAPAWVGIAEAWINLADYWVAPRQAYPRALAAAARAVALDSTLAGGHAALGWTKVAYGWRLAEAEREFNQALALNGSSAEAYMGHSIVAMSRGQVDSAITLIRRAQDLDPLSPLNSLYLAEYLLVGGRYPEALAQCRKVLELDPASEDASLQMSRALVAQGKLEEALGWLRRIRGRQPDVQAGLARVYVAQGRRRDARRIADQLAAEAGRHYVRGELIAGVYAQLGDNDAAFRWLERAYGDSSSSLEWLKASTDLRPLHADPRFEALAKRVGLP